MDYGRQRLIPVTQQETVGCNLCQGGKRVVYWCNVHVCLARFPRSQAQASRGKSATSTWIGTFQEAI